MKPVVSSAADEGTQWDPTSSIMGVLNGSADGAAAPAAAAAEPVVLIPPPPVGAAPAAAAEQGEDTGSKAPASAIPAGLIPGAKAPEPVVVAEPAEEADPPEITNGSPKGKHAWTTIKAEKKELAAKLKLAEQKLKDAEARMSTADQTKPPEAQVLIDLQKQVQEYEDKVGKMDITQSRAFRTRFDLPIERTFKRGEAILQRAGLQQAEASSLMKKLVEADAHQASELIADQPLPVQGALFTLTTEFSEMVTEREDAIKNWRQTNPALKETEARNQEITLAQNIEQDTSEAIQQALKEGNFMYTQNTTMPAEWNAGVDQRVNLVKGILRTAKPAELVKWVAEGVTAKDLRDMLAKEHDRANQLSAELNARANLRPRINGRGDGPPPPPSKEIQPLSPESVVAGLFR